MKNIEKAHEINRKIMRKFHAVCKKYGITYFYDSGSLIGAVRHQSFIPWDDDIDVAMKREDFWKLLQVPETEWGDSFRIVAPSEIAPGHFLDFTWRLMCMDETVPIKTYDGAVTPPEEFRDHIGLDILLLDNAHDSSFRHFFHRLHLYYVYGKILGHREWRRESYPFPANLAVKIFSAIGRKQPLPSLYEEYDRV